MLASMPVITITLSWKEQMVSVVQEQEPAVHHVPGCPEHSFYRRPVPCSQFIRKGGWRIEICESDSVSPTDWSAYKFKRLAVVPGVVQWMLTFEENRMLETGTTPETWNLNTPPMALVTQFLGVLEGKGCEVVGTSSMYCGEGTGPIWVWNLTF